jgi:hypothetical protein
VVEVKERWAKYLAMVRLYARAWHSEDADQASGFRVPPLMAYDHHSWTAGAR